MTGAGMAGGYPCVILLPANKSQACSACAENAKYVSTAGDVGWQQAQRVPKQRRVLTFHTLLQKTDQHWQPVCHDEEGIHLCS